MSEAPSSTFSWVHTMLTGLGGAQSLPSQTTTVLSCPSLSRTGRACLLKWSRGTGTLGGYCSQASPVQSSALPPPATAHFSAGSCVFCGTLCVSQCPRPPGLIFCLWKACRLCLPSLRWAKSFCIHFPSLVWLLATAIVIMEIKATLSS